MTKKYIVYPGYIVSQSDGDEHYLQAHHLFDLYKVNHQECIVYVDDNSLNGYTKSFIKGLIELYPRADGNYEVPAKN